MNAELMAQIQGGKPLRKSITNDRSVVAAAGKITDESSVASNVGLNASELAGIGVSREEARAEGGVA